MRKSILTVLLAFALAGAAAAKDNLAILPFTGGAGEEGETIAELFSFESTLTAVFNPVPRTSINRAIRNEQRFQMTSGMTDPDTIAALGKQLGAQYVVSGSISKLGAQKLLIIAILKIDELRQIAGDIQTYGDIEEIQDKLPAMARAIVAAAKQDASRLPRLAVVPVQLAAGADKRDADVLAQILAAHIIKNGKYAVYPRTASLEQVENEYKNQLNGDTADEHMPDVGKGTNPDLVLSVTARKLGTRNMFNAAVINLVTGVQEAGESVNYQSLNEGITAMTVLAAALSGNKTVSSAEAVKPAPVNTGSGNTVSNAEDFRTDFKYEIYGSGASRTVYISKYSGKGGRVVIPDRIDGIPVTVIGYQAFWSCWSLTSITIPSSVREIGEEAFKGCSSLTSITIPSSVTTIGKGAFWSCSSLTNITIPSSVREIGAATFYVCRSLTSVTIPSSVTTIGGQAFRGCSSLTSVTIPSSVTTIGYAAFMECSSLTSVSIPSSVTTIDYATFEECRRLTSVTIPSSVTTIRIEAFKGCRSLASVTLSRRTKLSKGVFPSSARIRYSD